MARILVVDDDRMLLSALGNFLRSKKHLVTSTNNGADAICLLAKCPAPELMILDMQMPGVDGAEVLESLKGLGHPAPAVIVISGDPDRLHQAMGHPAVARAFLKPVPDIDEFCAAINDVVKNSLKLPPDSGEFGRKDAPRTQDSAPGC